MTLTELAKIQHLVRRKIWPIDRFVNIIAYAYSISISDALADDWVAYFPEKEKPKKNLFECWVSYQDGVLSGLHLKKPEHMATDNIEIVHMREVEP